MKSHRFQIVHFIIGTLSKLQDIVKVFRKTFNLIIFIILLITAAKAVD